MAEEYPPTRWREILIETAEICCCRTAREIVKYEEVFHRPIVQVSNSPQCVSWAKNWESRHMRCQFAIAFALILPLPISVEPAAAATPRSAPSTTKVDQVLLLEAQEGDAAVDRRKLLITSTDIDFISDSARWQAGFVKTGMKWQAVDPLIDGGVPPVLKEYRTQRHAAPKTAEGHLKLANWCRSQKLVDQERAHLSEMLTLSGPEVDRVPIYRRMGYRPWGGQWLSPAEFTAAQAQVRHWQESLREWQPKFERIARDWEAAPKQQQQAKENLNAVQDAAAIPAMLAVAPMSRTLALAICDRLKELDCFESSQALATIAIQSEWASVRESATEGLQGRRLDDFVPALLAAMRSPFRIAKPSNNQVSPRIIFREESDRYVAIDVNMVPMIASVVFVPRIQPSALASISNELAVKRSENDLLRSVAAIDHDIQQRVEKENEYTDDYITRAALLLALLSGQELTVDPRFWWAWWQLYTGTVPVPKKCHVVRKQVALPIEVAYLRRSSCLVAGTPVQTERGQVPVEMIEVGDRVLSKNIETGELAYKPVLHTTVREDASVKEVLINGKSIVASDGHHFWISGKGWVKTHELKAGDPIHTVTGTTRLTSLETEPRPESVYNLVVADFHTYFVGQSLILSHDVLQPASTNTKVPGLQPARSRDE